MPSSLIETSHKILYFLELFPNSLIEFNNHVFPSLDLHYLVG